jgi:hypothetical protein
MLFILLGKSGFVEVIQGQHNFISTEGVRAGKIEP